MTHPLFSLISQRAETAPESPQIASDTSMAGNAPVADGLPQKSRGDAGGVDGGADGADGGSVGIGEVEPADPWQPAAGLSILAILDPAGPDGQSGRAYFAPGLTLAERRAIMFDDEWLAVRVRRRASETISSESESEPDR